MTSRSVPLLAVLGTLVVVGAFGLGGYAVGKSGAPDEEDAAAERAAGRREVLADAHTAATRERRDAVDREATAGERRGRRAGASAGEQAGEAEIADTDVGPTPLDEPLIPADVYSSQLTGGQLTDQPSEIALRNHTQLEDISWSESGGEVAIGSGTLVRIGACEPSCADAPGERVPATIKAWEPAFTSDSVRFYSKITVEPSDDEKFTLPVSIF